ncbi:MAG: polysaccharide biosynthesis C-terminal domain-containing protein [Saprospiraceae bacterium]|nr:polysaccharide biosynthesis C-terminal domain-containing protein [Saprospiraceae bacterium]
MINLTSSACEKSNFITVNFKITDPSEIFIQIHSQILVLYLPFKEFFRKHMRREFVLNIVLLIFINLLIKPIYIFGIEARIQNLVGTESYGLYFDYFNFVFLFQFINDPGIQSWNAQFVPKVKDQIGFHFPRLLLMKLYLGVFYLVVVSIMAAIFGYERYDLILLLSVNMALSALFMYFRGTIAGLGYYRIDSLLSALDKLLMIFILGYLAWISSYQLNFSIDALVYGQGAAFFISCLVAYLILIKKVKNPQWGLEWAYIKEKFIAFLPYTLVIFLVAGYSRLDGVMLGRMLDDNNYQSGLYATAFRFYDAAGMVGYLFAALLLPMYASSLNNRIMLSELLFTGLRFVVVCALIISLSLSYYSMEFMNLLYDDATQEFGDVLIVMNIGFVMVAIAYIFGTLLVSADKVRNLNYLYGAGLLLNFLLNLILIPKYFSYGAAITTVFTQVLILGGQVYYAQKLFQFTWKRDLIVQLSIYILSCFMVFSGLKYYFEYPWYVILSVSIFISLLLAFILKIIDLSEGLKLIRLKKI